MIFGREKWNFCSRKCNIVALDVIAILFLFRFFILKESVDIDEELTHRSTENNIRANHLPKYEEKIVMLRTYVKKFY